MTDSTTPDPPDLEDELSHIDLFPQEERSSGGGLAWARQHFLLLAAGAAVLLLLAGLVNVSGDLSDSEALATQRAEEIDDLDGEVLALAGEVDDLEDDLRRSESSLSVMRSARDEAEATVEACEPLPGNVTQLLSYMVDFIEWAELGQTNVAAAAAQGDAMVAQQERVLGPLGETLERCRDAS